MEEMQNAVVTEQNEPTEALPTGEEGEIHKESKEDMDIGNKEAEAQEPTKRNELRHKMPKPVFI